MPLRRAFAPMLPEFDSFLFAAVGEERDGIPLSVLSALSRLGLDPRDEAARLSRLTKAEPIPGSRVSRFRVYSALLAALLVSLIAGGFLFLGS